jgi:hypothetical protein
MPSARETALAGLSAVLLQTGATVWRDTDINRPIPPGGLIELTDGEAFAEAMLSPIAYDIAQQAEILVAVTADDEPARDAALDALLSSIHSLITADRTLDGAVDDTELGTPGFEAFEADGAAKAARIPCVLHFRTTGSPLG